MTILKAVWEEEVKQYCSSWSKNFLFVAARAWLFVGFLLAFGGLVGSLWVFIQQFLVPGECQYLYVTDKVLPHLSLSLAVEYDIMGPTNATILNATTIMPTPTVSPLPTVKPSPAAPVVFNPYWWQGIAFFLQNLFIFLRYRKTSLLVSCMCLSLFFSHPALWCSSLDAQKRRKHGDTIHDSSLHPPTVSQ